MSFCGQSRLWSTLAALSKQPFKVNINRTSFNTGENVHLHCFVFFKMLKCYTCEQRKTSISINIPELKPDQVPKWRSTAPVHPVPTEINRSPSTK